MARRGLPRRGPILLMPLLAVALALPVLLIDDRNGLRPLAELTLAARQARAQTARLARERLELREKLRGLRVDPFEVEALARATLGMVRPGEVVVRLGPSDGGVE